MTQMHTKDTIKALAPASLWEHFYEISQIPRCSGDEEAVRNYVKSIAEIHELAYKIDGVGNILVKKPATAGLDARI